MNESRLHGGLKKKKIYREVGTGKRCFKKVFALRARELIVENVNDVTESNKRTVLFSSPSVQSCLRLPPDCCGGGDYNEIRGGITKKKKKTK